MQLGSIQLGRLKVSLSLLWYDLWVGVYVARKPSGTVLYVCPLPCCVLQVEQSPTRETLKDKFQEALQRRMQEERIAQAQQDARGALYRKRYKDTFYAGHHNEEDEEHA